ncbi:hypothetical protein SEA_JACOREN57_58 [Mycobacterium phage JacoRen57]|nr:hypothetical protein SEA_JACOREN57_58 [Mycobacterium phage JacoRen57]
MPKQRECKYCGKKLKEVPHGNGYAHKKKEHWTSHPHKATPEATLPAPEEASA